MGWLDNVSSSVSSISDNISKAVKTAQTIGDQASELAKKAKGGLDVIQDGLDAIQNASKILQSEDDLLKKGESLVTLAKEVFDKSKAPSVEVKKQERTTKQIPQSPKNSVKSTPKPVPATTPNTNPVSVAKATPAPAVKTEKNNIKAEDCKEVQSRSDGIGWNNRVVGGSAVVIPVIETAAEATKALALMGTEIAKAVQICEIEETKRTEIEARMEVELARINAISTLISDYLNRTFDERADLFDKYFKTLDKAIENGDSELMAATLGSINSLAAQNPFKNLSDLASVQNQLGCANAEWDI